MSRTILLTLLATAALGMIVTTASAGRFSISNQNFRITWTSLQFETQSHLGRVLCPTTIEGSFHYRTIVKTVGALIGYITRAIVQGESPPCQGGTATVLTETLPWHVTYGGFNGTLPSISGIRLNVIGLHFLWRVEAAGVTCLMTSTAENPMRGTLNINGSGQALTFTPDRSAPMPLVGGICALTRGILLEDPGTVTLLGNNNVISVTLI